MSLTGERRASTEPGDRRHGFSDPAEPTGRLWIPPTTEKPQRRQQPGVELEKIGEVTLTDKEKSVLAVGIVAVVSFFVIVLAAVTFPEATKLMSVGEFSFLVHLTFGILIVHAFAGGLGVLLKRGQTRMKEAMRVGTTVMLAAVSWLTVITGTWITYIGYRAKPPEGADVQGYPQAYLEANDMAYWHDLGMEWKEHVGWLVPILATAVAFVVFRHGALVARDSRVRTALTTIFVIAFAASAVAAGLGAAINAIAPNDFLN